MLVVGYFEGIEFDQKLVQLVDHPQSVLAPQRPTLGLQM